MKQHSEWYVKVQMCNRTLVTTLFFHFNKYSCNRNYITTFCNNNMYKSNWNRLIQEVEMGSFRGGLFFKDVFLTFLFVF